jgi:hypothetical protein
VAYVTEHLVGNVCAIKGIWELRAQLDVQESDMEKFVQAMDSAIGTQHIKGGMKVALTI